MASNNYFGRQLDAKRTDVLQNLSACNSILIDADKIDESPKNSLIFAIDDDKLHSLADYMKEVGVHEPITCYQKNDGRYEILSGHRRFRARLLNGDKKIDVIVRAAPKTEGDKVYQLIFDNIHSRVLTPIDTARAMQEIKENWIPEKRAKGLISGNTKDILADKFGVSPSAVQRTLSLLQLIPALQQKVAAKVLPVDAAILIIQESNEREEAESKKMQEFVDAAIDYAKESTQDFTCAAKNDIASYIARFNAQKESTGNEIEAAQKTTSKSKALVTKQKYNNSVKKFQSIITSDFANDFRLEAKDIETLKQLQEEIANLIANYN